MMKRSQIYLPAEQWRRLDALSHQTHQSVSSLIRKAIDRAYRNAGDLDFRKALEAAAGVWKDRKDLPGTGSYVRRLRRGTRLRRLHGGD